jgi:NADPH2:quinone reductase
VKAAWYERNGSARDVFNYGDLETPKPQEGEVRVRVHASGINPSDVNGRARRAPVGPRVIPHSDGAGVIEAVGNGVSSGRVGERVWIWNAQWKRPFGTAAEFVCLPQQQAVKLPDYVTFAAGACFGVPALTAVHALRQLGDVAGKTVLVTGAGSSVGYFATQMAKLAGARVIGTASASRADHAWAAGADLVIDYTSQDVSKTIMEWTSDEGVHGVIDIDLSTTAALIGNQVIRPHGTVACYGSKSAGEIPLSFLAMLMNSYTLRFFVIYDISSEDRAATLAMMSRMLEDNALTHAVAQTFPLNEIAAAHEAVESGRLTGNAVLQIA